MSSQYQPCSIEGKPEIPPWIPPEPTKLDIDFAKLHTIDLSLLDSPDQAIVDQLIATCKSAIREDGFLFLTNYGVTLEQLHRQFAIGQYTLRNISEEEKKSLLWNPVETGKFAGYKHPYGWSRNVEKRDGIHHFNYYAPQFADLNNIPACTRPFMDEITSFCTYLTQDVNRRLLKLLSRVLELPDDYLWDNVQGKGAPIGQAYFRHALFEPLTEETRESGGGLRMNGHTDQGTTTMLFSVPVSCLQIWGKDKVWRYVGYNPGAMVINLGDILEVVSGGHFKATRHRVIQPPADQEGVERLSLVLFNAADGPLRMEPAKDSPLIQRDGYIEEPDGIYKQYAALMRAGAPVPTNAEWRQVMISNIKVPNHNAKLVLKEVNGSKMYMQNYFGVEVALPV